jgi:hypothetical protein
MAAPKLSKEQQRQLIYWLAEGWLTEEINELAAKFDPPFSISKQLNVYYRDSYAEDIARISAELDRKVFNEGLSLARTRIDRLEKLARILEDDLYEKKLVWLEQVKGIGSGEQYERIDFEEFNAAEIKALQSIYDDIAKETGGRIHRLDVSGKGLEVKAYVTLSPDDWDESEPGDPSAGSK